MPANFPISASASAPAILDVMGGISDTSGGICLSYPLAIATTCHVTPRDSPDIRARFNGSAPVEIARDNVSHGAPQWAQIVANTIDNLPDDLTVPGLEIEIVSQIPRDAGLGDESALEVAVFSAINRALNLGLKESQITRSTSLSTNLTRANHLSQIKYQPALAGSYIVMPDGLELWAIDSGVPQSAGQNAYDIAFCATKMGATMLSEIVSNAMCGPDGELYLANIGTDVWRALRSKIPEKLSGAQFLERHETLPNLESDRVYNVRLATEHPIYETDRAIRFAHLMNAINENPIARTELARAAGELMIQSHFSYDHRCNLNGPATDLLVELARASGPKRGIYGAKITGRGGGGCIALLCDRDTDANLERALEEICASYHEQSGRVARVYRGL